MMKKMMIAALLLASSSMAMAQAYVGGTVGYGSNSANCYAPAECSMKSAIGKVFGGYAFNENVAVEVSYADFGSAKASSSRYDEKLKSSAFGVRAVGSYPLNKDFSLFAAAGLNLAKSKYSASGIYGSDSANDTSTAPSLAIGLDYTLTQSLKLRGEIESVRFKSEDTHYNVTGVSVGLKYAF